MLSPKLILSPIDFSDFSLNALDVAKDVAMKYGSEILLIHVVPMVSRLPDPVIIVGEGAYERAMIEITKQRLGDLADKLRQAGVRARSVVGLANDAAMEIVRTADSEKVDLIVMSTHGMTGWKRLAFGSVTDKVVRTADCAVLVLRSGAAAGSPERQAKQATATVPA
ncbi:MAG TPA: universal stress protein [Candidatus Acidoferrum sp.]|nr:universal stress protein [Candidatus Acidoferrum sp.]